MINIESYITIPQRRAADISVRNTPETAGLRALTPTGDMAALVHAAD